MSTKDFGCFYCTGKAILPSDVCPDCGEPIDISERLTGLTIAEYKVTGVLGRGFNGWTVLAEDHYQRFAIKIIPKHRSKHGVFKEPKALADCSPHPNITRFVRFMDLDLLVGKKVASVSCLVFEHVPNARSLGDVVEDHTIKLCRGDVVSILRGIAKGLERMHARNLWHDDLHDDNILLREVQSDEDLPGRFEAKLIDFGSAKPRDPLGQEKSDYAYLSKHIFSLVHRFEHGNQAELTPTDRTFAARLRRLGHCLADSNVSRRSMSPLDISKEVSAAYDECSIGHNYSSFEDMKKHLGVALTEPLENTNALYLAPQDIALLFRDALGWTQRLHRSEPVMVVGPRGCGKTMLLRYLSIGSCARPTQLNETPDDVKSRLDDMRHVGFLINVGQLRTPFLRSAYKQLERSDANIAEEFCREYLNLSFGYEVVRSLVWLDTEHILPLTADDKELLVALLASLLPIERDIRHESLHSLAEAIDRRVMALSNFRTRADYTPTQFARDDVLHRFGQTLRRMTWARNKEIWFLLDDYSVTVIPELAQKAYNPVLFFPSTELRIKISSEGEGPNVTDTLMRKYREGREVCKVNLGEVYFQSGENAGRQFFESILEARFTETGKGSIQDLSRLLGEHESESSFGAYINSLHRPGDARFYGFGIICQLCSGDVSFIIELLHSLTQGRWDAKSGQISMSDQDAVIKRFAQRQLSELRNVADYGMRLHTFANCMGDMIKGYLVRSKGKAQPDERLRIEIEGTGDMSADAQRMHEALLRYSVLISGGAGKSKAGLPTKKLFFRRMFAPCYPFSPSRSGCIAVTTKEYENWLLDPMTMKTRKTQVEPSGGLFDSPS
ncbi:MAG: protein kinase [Pseudomonadota bacterium]